MRTPIGRYGGALSGVRPDDLAAVAIAAAVERSGVDPAVDRGRLLRLREPGRARTTGTSRAWPSLLAGLPESVAGVTLNRLCASGLSAVVSACHAILAGDAEIAVAGGVESMSRAPLVMAKPDAAFPRGNQTVWDTTLGWRFPNPRLEELFPLESMGETGENVAERWEVSREDQDAFALRSQQRWAAANEAGRFDDELVPVGDVASTSTRAPTTTAEALAALKPAFRDGGTVTAGNASGINDGAAALVIASEEKARELGVEPLGAFVGECRRRGRPARDGHRARPGRSQAARPAPGSTVDELDLVELNEAFASQSLAVDPRARPRRGEGQRERRRDRARPPARDERRAPRRLAPARAPPAGGRYGLATLCVGVGQGEAALFERGR